MRTESAGIKCQICGAKMEPVRIASKRRWYFACPRCGERSPIRDGRAKAAEVARTYDAIAASQKRPVRCPYWMRSMGRDGCVECEAPCEGGESVRVAYADRRAMARHMARYCRSGWEACPLARIIGEKYEDPPG